jgi:hypothetical protein
MSKEDDIKQLKDRVTRLEHACAKLLVALDEKDEQRQRYRKADSMVYPIEWPWNEVTCKHIPHACTPNPSVTVDTTFTCREG